MKDILLAISALTIENADVPYTEEQKDSGWIGFGAATTEEIFLLEQSLGLSLPQDYKDFLALTNGFSAVNDSTEPNFFTGRSGKLPDQHGQRSY
ncbi:SMI1/KNR4 family protein [Pedobacter sp. GR22-6]|uniref:SMI1/KNR4 family protein n=1 Tax=Pedobacter sp. GR22-6 TaxID=3127957 RepID=UPI00307FCBC5